MKKLGFFYCKIFNKYLELTTKNSNLFIEVCLDFPATGEMYRNEHLTRVKLQKNERNGETHLSHKGFLATVIFFESADPFTACK